MDWYLTKQHATVKVTYPGSCTLWKLYWLIDFIVVFLKFSSLKSNRLTCRSWSGKQSRFGHVIKQEKCHAVTCWEFHLILNLVNHINPAQCPTCLKASIQLKRAEGSHEKVENSSKCVFVPMSNDNFLRSR